MDSEAGNECEPGKEVLSFNQRRTGRHSQPQCPGDKSIHSKEGGGGTCDIIASELMLGEQ